MRTMDVDKAVEEEKKFFKEIQRGVLIPILKGIEAKGRGELSALADRMERHGLKHARVRLSELKRDRRDLTFFSTSLLIEGGVMTIDQIMRGRRMDELGETEQRIIRKLQASDEILQEVARASADGFDVLRELKGLRKK